jgi:hypothetical protein
MWSALSRCAYIYGEKGIFSGIRSWERRQKGKLLLKWISIQKLILGKKRHKKKRYTIAHLFNFL